MSGWNRCWCRRSLALSCAFLVGTVVVPDAHGDPVFSLTVGQTFQPPSDGDPGPYAPNGFPTIAGNYQATTTQEYYNGGTTWSPVPDGGWQAALIQTGLPPTPWTPIAPLPGDTANWIMTLNSLGHVVGNSTTSPQNSWVNIWQDSPGTDHAFYFSLQGGTIPLRTLDGTSGLPMSINNLDQVVGESYTASGAIHGFLTMPGGVAYDLNSLIPQGSGYTILAGYQIDDQGRISAMAKGPDGLDYYVYLTPNEPLSKLFGGAYDPPPNPPANTAPEPAPICLLGLVVACRVAQRLRCRQSRAEERPPLTLHTHPCTLGV
jgi:probable HAF family extracellular repeat protein